MVNKKNFLSKKKNMNLNADDKKEEKKSINVKFAKN